MIAAQKLLASSVDVRAHPFNNWGRVDMANRRCSRAAAIAPSIPTISVRCWVIKVAPAMPVCKVERKNISISGRTTIAVSASATAKFSLLTTKQRQRIPFNMAIRLGRTPDQAIIVSPLYCDTPELNGSPHQMFPLALYGREATGKMFLRVGAIQRPLPE